MSKTEEIARFGDAYIERDLAGRIVILGGTTAERARAKEWLNRWKILPEVARHQGSC